MSVQRKIQVPVVHTIITDDTGRRCDPLCRGYIRGPRAGRSGCREFLRPSGDRSLVYGDIRLTACLAAEALQESDPRPFR